MNWEVTGRDGESIPAMQKRIKDYLGLRPYFYGDYYPLTASRTTIRDNSWLAYQLNRPDKDDGIVLAFRRKDCTDESINIKLMGLGPKTIYTLDFEDYGLQMEKSGSELMNGLDISIPLKPASLLIRYHKK
jgi:alpha-galactosidase